MSLEIIFGKNKTGKTQYLETKYNNSDPNVLFIETEIDFEKILKGNFGTAKKISLSPHKKIIDFLNNFLVKSLNVKVVSDEEFNKLKEFKQNIDSFSEELKNDKDDFFEDCIKNSIETIEINKEFEYEFELIKLNVQKRNGSSGSLVYSLIKLLYKMVLSNKIEIKDEYKLVIDEIEKFLHPELIFKIANMVVKISEKINVILTTHSPLFLERIWTRSRIFYLHKNKIISNINCDIKYSLKYKHVDGDYSIKWNDIDNGIFSFNKEEITKILKKKNYRIITNLANFVFSSKCFLIEGLIDNSLINDIINEIGVNNPYTIIDCHGKNQIKVMLDMVRNLNIVQYYQICLFYDSDREEKFKIKENEKNNIFDIVNDPNIEEKMFVVRNDSNKIINIETKHNKISKNNFKKEKLNETENFIFSMKWIKENSTKDKKEVDNNIEELKNKVNEFMNK